MKLLANVKTYIMQIQLRFLCKVLFSDSSKTITKGKGKAGL